MGTTWIVIYRGESVPAARAVAVSADPEVVADVAARILASAAFQDPDPILVPLVRGQRDVLRLIVEEATDGNVI